MHHSHALCKGLAGLAAEPSSEFLHFICCNEMSAWLLNEFRLLFSTAVL